MGRRVTQRCETKYITEIVGLQNRCECSSEYPTFFLQAENNISVFTKVSSISLAVKRKTIITEEILRFHTSGEGKSRVHESNADDGEFHVIR